MAPTFTALPNALLHVSGLRLDRAGAMNELAHHLATAKSMTVCAACRANAEEMVAQITAAMAASFPDFLPTSGLMTTTKRGD